MKKNNPKKEYAKRYLIKYIKELKVHFDMNDKELREVLYSVSYLKSPIHNAFMQIKKYIKEKI